MLFKFKENISTLIASSFRSTPILLTHTLTGKLNSNYFIADTQSYKCSKGIKTLTLLLLQLPRVENIYFVPLTISHGKHPHFTLLLGYSVLMESSPQTLKSPNSIDSQTSNLPFMQRFIKVITVVMKPLLF